MACSEVCTLLFRSCMSGCVLLYKLRIPVSPFPTRTLFARDRLSRLRVLWADLTPDCIRLPYLLFRSASLPSDRNFRVSQVLVRFSRHTPRSLWTPADLRKAHQFAFSVLTSGSLRPSSSAFRQLSLPTQFSGLYQVFRKCGLPCGLRRSLCTLQ